MEEKMLNITVSFEFDKFRLDKFLQNQLKNYSRTKLQNLIKEGCVKLNNNIINAVIGFNNFLLNIFLAFKYLKIN